MRRHSLFCAASCAASSMLLTVRVSPTMHSSPPHTAPTIKWSATSVASEWPESAVERERVLLRGT